MISRWILLPLAALCIASAGFFAGYASHTQPSQASARPPAKPPSSLPSDITLSAAALKNLQLKSEPAQTHPLMRQLQVNGIVGFNQLRLARVTAPAPGKIEAILVGVGDHVEAGQPLAILNNFDLGMARNDVISSQAAVVQARAELSTAQAALARAIYLVSVGGMAESELEARRAEVARAQAALRTDLAAAQQRMQAEQRLMPVTTSATTNAASPASAEGEIVAPFAGVIDSVAISSGQLVDPSLPTFTLADLSVVWIKLDVPEQELADLTSGDAVDVQVDAFPGRTFRGQVTYIADQVDPSSGTISVRCNVPNADGALRVNMFATAVIEVPLGRDAVVVPDSALQDINGQTSVFIPEGKGKFRRQVIHPGLSSGGVTEVRDGIAPNTPIVTQGSYWLKAKLLETTISDSG